MWRYVVASVSGVAVGLIGGILLEKLMRNFKDNRVLKCSEMLEKNFGKPMITNKFTFAEAKEWILARQDKINNGYKGVILKINKETLEKIGSNLEIDKNLNNYLLIGIYKDKNFLESLLVKYDFLDEELSDSLKEGTLVIE
jgi:hypothetical protein